MDAHRFDQLARTLARGASRRRVIKGLAASAAGGLAAVLGGGVAAQVCRENGRLCTKNANCCSGYCDLTNPDPFLRRKCACPPGNAAAWTPQSTGGASVTTGVTGPGTPPLPPTSARFIVGPNGDDFTNLRNTGFAGLRLDAITELTYWTHVTTYMGCQAVYLILHLDHDGDGDVDDRIFFEPCYQTGTYGGDPVPAQGAPVLNTWQQWNALTGGWWAINDATFGPPLRTIAGYLAEFPNATIVNADNCLGGVRLVAGGGAGAWDNFVGNSDAFKLNGVTGNF